MGIGSMLAGLGQGIQNLPNTLGANLYPVDPAMAAQVDPKVLEQARRQALIRAGLGFSAASQTGAGFGQAALAGINAGQPVVDSSLARSLQMQAAHEAAVRQAEKDRLEQQWKLADYGIKRETLDQKKNAPAKAASPTDDLAKLNADKAAGFLSQEDYDIRRKALLTPKPVADKPDPAPSLTEVIDPKDPTRKLRVDGRIYKGGSIGDPGVLGVSGEAGKSTAPSQTSAESAAGFLANAGYDPQTGEDDITKLLKQATGGMVQSLRDSAARAVNSTTSGAAASQTLKSRASEAVLGFLGGKLGAGVSNADRDFMMQRAGDVGNEKLSTGERRAAWLDVRGRMERIAKSAPAPVAPAAPGKTITRTGTLNGRKVVQYSDGTTDYAP